MPHLLIHTHVTSLNILRKCPTLPAESNKQKKCIMPLHSGIYNTWGNLLYIFDIVHSQSETYQIGPLSRNCEFSCLTPHTTIIPQSCNPHVQVNRLQVPTPRVTEIENIHSNCIYRPPKASSNYHVQFVLMATYRQLLHGTHQ